MVTRYFLPLLAVLALGFAVFQVVRGQTKPPPAAPPVEPARNPFAGRTVSGAGLVEPLTENIAVGAHVPGVVTKVHVQVGTVVNAGQVLFEVDDRQLRAERESRRAALAAAQAQLDRLRAQPRTEEVPPLAAKVREARASLVDQEDQLRRAEELFASRALGEEELIRRRQAVKVAREQLARAEAELKLLTAGAWAKDVRVAEAAVQQAQAQVKQTETELERLKVRAPVAGTVLQKNVRAGEYVGAPPNQTLMVLGDVSTLHVRVDVDENDVSRFEPGLPGRAMLRGNPRVEFKLKFVRVEPYVIPKKSLTGANTERVDVRVLQVIYAVEPPYRDLYVGQQVDVFLDPASASPGQAGS